MNTNRPDELPRCLGMLLAAYLLVVACIPGRTLVQTAPPIEAIGRIDGSSDNSSGDCIWIDVAPGNRIFLLFAERVNAHFGPFFLTDDDGKVLARAGDTVRVTGPSGTVGDTSCAPGTVPFLVEDFSTVPP